MSFKLGGQEVPHRTVFLAFSEIVLVISVLLATMSVHGFFTHGGGQSLQWRDLAQVILVTLISGVCLYYNDIYELNATRNLTSTLVRLSEAFGITCFVLAALYFAVPSVRVREGVTIEAAPLIVLMIFAWRLMLERAGLMSRRDEKALVLGTGPVGIAAVREVCARPELNLEVVGFLDSDPRNVGKPLVNPGIVATIDDLETMIDRYKVTRVIIAPKEEQMVPTSTLLRLKFAGIAVEDAGALLERITGRIAVDTAAEPRWLILSDGFRRSRFTLLIKRMFDVAVASTLLILSLPAMALVAVAIVWESGFPILFRQTRIGLNEKPFQILKFRSMKADAEAQGPAWTSDNDRRITRVGHFIRTHRLDELPQLLNVLRGDMSLIGPRPEQPYFCQLLEKEIPFFEQRHRVRPGITGWAQIKYRYTGNVEDARRKLEFDMFYIKHLSPILDFVIVLETLKVVLNARGSK